MTLRIDAGLNPSRFERASVRDPTGSPVEIKVSTRAVRISRSRFPILGSAGILLNCLRSRVGRRGEQLLLVHSLTILDAEAYVLDRSYDPVWILGTGWNGVKPGTAGVARLRSGSAPDNAPRGCYSFPFMKAKPDIVVVGAGAFGGWTALHLLERGARVTLLDAWGPGNSRSSSGGETRVMRGTYGPDQPYTEMAASALKLWARYERRWKRQFLHRSGVLWMAASRDDAFERGSIEMLQAAKIKYQEVSAAQLRTRWPQINFDGIEWAIFEPECGYLDARASCAAVVDAFVAAGGRYRQASVLGQGLEDSPLRSLSLTDGAQLKAHIYVFGCGPWLGKLFPQAVGPLIQATR